MNANEAMLWLGVVQQLVALGVKSWALVHALLQDAGADDATVAALQPKWTALRSDVARAAGVDPTP